MMADYTTVFGALDNFRKGGVDLIEDDPKNYVFSNVFDVASKSSPTSASPSARTSNT